jgi:hypothetical protein
MDSLLPEPLDRRAQIQRGVVSARQLHLGGVSHDVIASRVRHGRWQQLHRGVYATFSGEPNRDAILWAASLWAGRDAVLSYHTAAELHRLVDVPSMPIHVTIPGSRRVTPVRGVLVHRAKGAIEAAHSTQLPPRTRIEETVLDLTQVANSAEQACGWIVRAVGRRLTTQARISAALQLRPRMRFRSEIAQVLTPEYAGIHSMLEYRYVRRVESPHGLPAGRRQVRVSDDGRTRYRDVLYDDYKLIVELDGKIAHPGDARWNDIRRDNAAAAGGFGTLRYGWQDLDLRACIVADELYRAMRTAGPVTARPCCPLCPVARTA